jgi:hypothetical protein
MQIPPRWVCQQQSKENDFMIKSKIKFIFFVITFMFMASVAHADVVWPALYVASSHFRVWYVVILGLLLEAVVLRWRLLLDTKKALLISFIANAFSSTVGIFILAFGMLGWHFIVDNFVEGTFASFNKIATIGLMLIGSTFLEVLVVRGLWKYPIRQTLPVFILGNILSYGVIIADLFIFGGWHRQF